MQKLEKHEKEETEQLPQKNQPIFAQTEQPKIEKILELEKEIKIEPLASTSAKNEPVQIFPLLETPANLEEHKEIPKVEEIVKEEVIIKEQESQKKINIEEKKQEEARESLDEIIKVMNPQLVAKQAIKEEIMLKVQEIDIVPREIKKEKPTWTPEKKKEVEEIKKVQSEMEPKKYSKLESVRYEPEIIPREENKNTAIKEERKVLEISPKEKPIKLLKHLFTVQINELAKIPILSKFIQKDKSNLFLRVSLPFDRSPIESDCIKPIDSQSYKVTMECSYSLTIMSNEDTNASISKQLQTDLVIELCALDLKNHIPTVLANGELPKEDILLVANDINKVDRVMFLYGTAAAEREGVIIGKAKLQLGHTVIPIEDSRFSSDLSKIWLPEKQITREIPQFCRLLVHINKIDGIDASRMGYAAKAVSGEILPPPEKLSMSVNYNPNEELIPPDKTKETEIDYNTDVVYCSGKPIFNTKWNIDFQSDEKIVYNLEHGFANFNILHADPSFSADETFGMTKTKNKGILIGTVNVPFAKMLGSHSGIINEAFEIKDRNNQCFGYLHLSMRLLDGNVEREIEESPIKSDSKYCPEKKEEQVAEEENKKTPVSQYPIAQMEVSIESAMRLKNPLDGI